MIDIDRLLSIAKDDGLHMRGLQILMLLRKPMYSTDVSEILGISSQNMASTLDQVRPYIKTAGYPDAKFKRWKIYSLNAKGKKYVEWLIGEDDFE